MNLLYILGGIVVVAIGVLGFLFYALNQEKVKAAKAGPVLEPIAAEPSYHVLKPTDISAMEQEYRIKIESLEDEVRLVSDKGLEQAREAMSAIDALAKENQVLKADQQKLEQEYKGQLTFAQQQAEDRRRENIALQQQLEAGQLKLNELEQEVAAARKQLEDELAQANAAMQQLRSERESLLASRVTSMQFAEVSREAGELKAQNEVLLQEVADLQMTNQKLKELNATMIEKAQMFQYELARNRAQASGLEKICENYRQQIGKLQER